MEKQKAINCPQCGVGIDVNEIVFQQLEVQIKNDYDKKTKQKENELAKQLLELDAEKKQVLSDKEKFNELVASKVQTSIKAQKNQLEKSIRIQLQEEASDQIKDLQKELEQKSTQVKELNKTKAEVERLKREKDEMKDQITLEKEAEMTERIKLEKTKIRTHVEQENTMKILELEKQLADQVKLAEEMQRKAEQGSMQLQGEVMELEIERILRELYVYDEVTEVKKGQNGADTLQVVKTQQGAVAGKIIWESKRTKRWESSWLKKIREDNLSAKADILVIVSQTMPEDQPKLFFKDNVWVCAFPELKALSLLLRHGLLQVHAVATVNHGRESKMEMLYGYLTSQEFSGTFSAIIEGFKGLQDNYADEKLKMQRIWKSREKQLEKILSNSIEFYGSIKGIAGSAIPEIKMLEEAQQDQE